MTSSEDKPPRGFAALTPEQRREIASRGGKSIRADQRSFSRDRGLAAKAGAKGGHARRVRRLSEAPEGERS